MWGLFYDSILMTGENEPTDNNVGLKINNLNKIGLFIVTNLAAYKFI
jgi:hypothetical protein